MDIENFLESGNEEEVIAFFTSFIPTINCDNKDNSLSINFNKLTEIIPNDLDTYLDESCIPAAEELRKKNIFVIGSLKTNEYTYLLLDKLSQENMNIFKEKMKTNKINYFLNTENLDYFGLRAKNTSRTVAKKLLSLISDFEMQDIQRGFLNEKNFLMNVCDCEKVEGLKEFEARKAEVVFDVQKMDKSFKDYLKDSGYEQYYLKDEHRVYINNFYFDAHQNYLNAINK